MEKLFPFLLHPRPGAPATPKSRARAAFKIGRTAVASGWVVVASLAARVGFSNLPTNPCGPLARVGIARPPRHHRTPHGTQRTRRTSHLYAHEPSARNSRLYARRAGSERGPGLHCA